MVKFFVLIGFFVGVANAIYGQYGYENLSYSGPSSNSIYTYQGKGSTVSLFFEPSDSGLTFIVKKVDVENTLPEFHLHFFPYSSAYVNYRGAHFAPEYDRNYKLFFEVKSTKSNFITFKYINQDNQPKTTCVKINNEFSFEIRDMAQFDSLSSACLSYMDTYQSNHKKIDFSNFVNDCYDESHARGVESFRNAQMDHLFSDNSPIKAPSDDDMEQEACQMSFGINTFYKFNDRVYDMMKNLEISTLPVTIGENTYEIKDKAIYKNGTLMFYIGIDKDYLYTSPNRESSSIYLSYFNGIVTVNGSEVATLVTKSSNVHQFKAFEMYILLDNY